MQLKVPLFIAASKLYFEVLGDCVLYYSFIQVKSSIKKESARVVLASQTIDSIVRFAHFCHYREHVRDSP